MAPLTMAAAATIRELDWKNDPRSKSINNRCGQGCQMASFHTKNPNLGKFMRILQWIGVGIFYGNYVGSFYGHLVYFVAIWYIFVAIWYILRPLVYFPPFWYIVPIKSGNTGCGVDNSQGDLMSVENLPKM
jgi:hypothetical protein